MSAAVYSVAKKLREIDGEREDRNIARIFYNTSVDRDNDVFKSRLFWIEVTDRCSLENNIPSERIGSSKDRRSNLGHANTYSCER